MREVMMSRVNVERGSTLGRALWGSMPLPIGAEYVGTVSIDGATGALLLAAGRYVLGNAGSVRSLPQREVRTALDSATSPAAELGRRGGIVGGLVTGPSKVRGDAEHYRAMAAKSAETRRVAAHRDGRCHCDMRPCIAGHVGAADGHCDCGTMTAGAYAAARSKSA